MRKAPRIMFFLAALLATASNTSAENLQSTVTKITDNSTDDTEPSLSPGNIAWRHQRAQEQESDIYYWNGQQTLQLTDTNTLKARPSASEGSVRATWSQVESNNAVWIYCWDGAQVTNRDRGFHASLNSGAVAYVQSVQATTDTIYWGRDPPQKISQGR